MKITVKKLSAKGADKDECQEAFNTVHPVVSKHAQGYPEDLPRAWTVRCFQWLMEDIKSALDPIENALVMIIPINYKLCSKGEDFHIELAAPDEEAVGS